MISRRFLLIFGVYAGLGLILSTITQKSLPPEQVLSLWPALPAFLIFLLFVMSVFSLGALIRKKMNLLSFSGTENGFFDLATGSVTFYVLAYALTAFHLFSSSLSLFLWIMLAIITAFGLPLIQPKRWFDFAKDTFTKWTLATPLLIVVIKLIEGTQIHLHADAYITYLPAPRIWAENGNFLDFTRFTQFFLSTSWESLYAWGTALMGLKAGSGLDLSQYFSQWCTGGIAVLGIIFAVLALCERLAQVFPVQTRWFPVVAMGAIQIPVLRWMANLAKHDIGIAFWGVSAFYFTVFLSPVSPLLAFLAGFITSAAVIGKLTIAFLGVGLGVYVICFSPRRAGYFVAGGILGGMPVFIRNYLITRNPVFPWLPNIFPSPLLSQGQTAAAMHATAHGFSFSDLAAYSIELQKELPLWGVFIIVFLVVAKRKEIAKLIAVPLFAALCFTIAFRPSTEIRYQNATLVILASLSIFLGFHIIAKTPKKFASLGSILFAVFLVANANITTFTLFQIGSDKFKPISKRLPELSGGAGKIWIRQNLKREDSILSMGDPHVYYTIDYSISELNQTPIWDDRFRSEAVSDFKNELLASPFQYLYIATDVPYWPDLEKAKLLLASLANDNSACRVFAAETAQIWSLRCLEAKTHLNHNFL